VTAEALMEKSGRPPLQVPGNTLDEFDCAEDHARRKPLRDRALAEVVTVLSEVTDRLKTIEQQRSRLGRESRQWPDVVGSGHEAEDVALRALGGAGGADSRQAIEGAPHLVSTR
jgi:hypothetical protein